jgi:hypothetical protein
MHDEKPMQDEERRRRDRRELVLLHRQVQQQELGAFARVHAYLRAHIDTLTSAADLRYLLRVVGEARWLGAAPSELIAEALAAIDARGDAWPKEGPTLPSLCHAIEQGTSLERPWTHEETKTPLQKTVVKTLREIGRSQELIPIVRQAAHRVARLRESSARADVYRVVLRRVLESLADTAIDPKKEAHALLAALESASILRFASDTPLEARGSLETSIASVLARPPHERPDALDEVLFSHDAVDELHATHDELAAILFLWG